MTPLALLIARAFAFLGALLAMLGFAGLCAVVWEFFRTGRDLDND